MQAAPRRLTRHVSSLLAFGLLLAAAPALAAPPTQKECLAAADDGQKLRDDGKLVSARDKFIMCAAKSCPNVVAKQCNQWLSDAEREMPSVTFRAIDDNGKETLEVKVSVDDKVVAQSIEAKAIAVDPGEHKVKFEKADGKSVEDKILLRPGEKNRLVELSFQTKAPPPPVAETPKPAPPIEPAPEPSRGFRVPTLGWVGLGIFAAGGITTIAFASMANGDESDLRGRCAPSCPESEKSGIDTKIAIANVGLFVGLAGLGLAVVTTVLENTGSKPAEKPQARPLAPKPSAASITFDVGPTGALVRGAF